MENSQIIGEMKNTIIECGVCGREFGYDDFSRFYPWRRVTCEFSFYIKKIIEKDQVDICPECWSHMVNYIIREKKEMKEVR